MPRFEYSVVTFPGARNHAAWSHRRHRGSTAAFSKDRHRPCWGARTGYLRAFSMTVQANESVMELTHSRPHAVHDSAHRGTPDGTTMISGRRQIDVRLALGLRQAAERFAQPRRGDVAPSSLRIWGATAFFPHAPIHHSRISLPK